MKCPGAVLRAPAVPPSGEDGMITVGVQEFTEEGTVNITLSAMGS